MSTNNDCNDCLVKRMDTRIQYLEDKLCDYEDVVDQNNKIQSNMSTALSRLDSMKIKQTDMFNELINRYNELSCNYNTEREQSIRIQEYNECLKSDNKQLYDKLDEQNVAMEKLEDEHSTLLENVQILQKQLLDITEMAKEFQDSKRQAELELKDKDKDIICIQNTLANEIKKKAQLEKNLRTEQDQNKTLQSSVLEMKIKYEKMTCSLQSEITELQSQLKEKSVKSCIIEQKLKYKQDELEEQNNRTTKLKEVIKKLQETYCKEKNKMDKEVDQLKVQVKSMDLDLTSLNKKLCDEQIESSNLKCQLKDREEMIKVLELTNERLQQEVRTIKCTIESTTNKLMMEREQNNIEKQMFDRKSTLKAQEECELKKLIKQQTEQIKQLKKQISDKVFNSPEYCASDMSVHKLETCIENLLNDDHIVL